jgi:hypothetical protein
VYSENGPRLLASAVSLAEIAKLVGRYWYSDTPYELRSAGKDVYSIHRPAHVVRPGQQIDGFRVIKKGRRFRFEELPASTGKEADAK